MYKCKECHRLDSSQHYEANKALYSAYYKQQRQCPEHRAKQARHNEIYRNRYPLKYKAKNAVSNAVAAGKLKSLPCLHCGALKTEAHHPDYSKPLDVLWLCRPCHVKEHLKQRKKTE